MPYLLGVDLGTTYSAAAVAAGDRVETIALGSRTATIPSVVALRADGTVLSGEAAERRAVTEPTRVAREFKRRLGDPVPIVVGGTPYGAETLMAHLLRGIVDAVAEQQGGRPDTVVLSHPAGYGPYKLDLLEQVGHLAELPAVEFITEPQAAAIHYSGLERIEPGDVVAVYDLGGGTFDAALVRRTDSRFELLGTPEGLERFGGIDLDEAVFDHVRRSLGRALDGLDPTDPAATSALARLRSDCREAKEALSSDTDAAVPVMLPNLHTEVRLTRAEFEDMIRPRLRETTATLGRVVRSAGLEFGDLSRVLLVGGSSRIPLVSEMVRDATGRPVALDANPKHAIALGAAAAGVAGAARATARLAPVIPAAPATDEPETSAESTPPVEEAAEAAEGEPVVEEPTAPAPAETAGGELEPDLPLPPQSEPAVPVPGRGSRRWLPWSAGIAAVVIAIAAVIGFTVLVGSDDDTDVATTAAAPDTTTEAPTTTAAATTTTTTVPEETTVPDEPEPPPDDGFPPVEGPDPSPSVLAVYFSNLMVPDARGEWGAWIGEGDYAPPDDIASDFYPLLGTYDATDPMVLAQHLAWMRIAGIGTVALVWEGPDSPSEQVMPLLFELAERYGLTFVLVLPEFERSPEEFLEAVFIARELHGEEPRWLRVEGRGGGDPQPVIIMGLPDEFSVDVDAWRPALEEAQAQGFTILVDSIDPVWFEIGADGLVGADAENSFEWAAALPAEALYVPAVSPGRSADRVGEPDLNQSREQGQRYRESWELAFAPRPPSLVMVNSFNHWRNGSQIEPASPEAPPREGLPYLDYEPLGPEDYLLITAEMIDALRYR
jgi:actin-like ATPase involved in cell morphogenesis